MCLGTPLNQVAVYLLLIYKDHLGLQRKEKISAIETRNFCFHRVFIISYRRIYTCTNEAYLNYILLTSIYGVNPKSLVMCKLWKQKKYGTNSLTVSLLVYTYVPLRYSVVPSNTRFNKGSNPFNTPDAVWINKTLCHDRLKCQRFL